MKDLHRIWLERLSHDGTWPIRPFMRDEENAREMMRLGLVELVEPGGIHMPYVSITAAGRAALFA